MAGQHEETTTEQFAARLRTAVDVNKKMAEFMENGTPADSEEVLDVMSEHHGWVTEYLRRDQKTYMLLAKKYRTDNRFAGIYDEYRDGLALYMGDAIEAYALARLTDDIPEDEETPDDFNNQ